MNFLITNSVPLNGGDEALLRATIESLKKRYPESVITTLCKDVEIARKHLPDLDLESDLEFVTADCIERVGKLYREADMILSAPGAFLHDFYSIEERLQGYEAALALQKPLILLGQSIGPFWKPESLRRIPQVLNRVARICVRDALSKQHLLDAGVNAEKINETGDMAFLWRTLAPGYFQEKTGPIETIGMGFRVWPLNDTKAEKEIIIKAVRLCRFLLDDPNRHLVFLSTCQGIKNYVDDSALAEQIIGELPKQLRVRCRINRSHLGPESLVKELKKCDAFIGMRLHTCILAMLGGVPAMGLAYEPKTRETYSQLGLEKFQISFETDAGAWAVAAQDFIDSAEEIREKLPAILNKACQQSELNLSILDEEVRVVRERKSESDTSMRRRTRREAMTSQQPELSISSHASIKVVQRMIPKASRFILVDDMHWTGRFSDRNPIPFLEKNGEYWGPPADDTKAISELERLRSEGAEFIVFASPCFWWLNYYLGFHSYLQRKYQHVFGNSDLVIYQLRRIF